MSFKLRRHMIGEFGPGWAVEDADGKVLPGRWSSEADAEEHGNSGIYLLSGVNVVKVGIKPDYPLTEAQARVLVEALGNDGWIDRDVRGDVLGRLIVREYVDQDTMPDGEVWVRVDDIGRDALRAHGYLSDAP